MLGDLRSKLEPIGKLDVLDAVGDQAMDYFAALGRRGTPREMLDRAKALRQIGDVRFHQGHLGPALKAFQQSLDQALTLHEAAPDDNNDLFELGQAEFWVGYVAWQRNDLQQAHASMQKYMQYTKELVDRAPQNADYRMELAYAHNNLGSVAKAQGHAEEALDEFMRAAAIAGAELKSKPDDAGLQTNLSEITSWISSTLQDLGRLRESEQAAEKAADLMRHVQEKGKDARASAKYADLLLLLADAQLRLGKSEDASSQIESARGIYKGLLAHDPTNADWRQSALNVDYYVVASMAPANWTPEIRAALAACASGLQELADKDPSDMTLLTKIAAAKRLEALGALERSDASMALRFAQEAHQVMRQLIAHANVPVGVKIVAAQVNETLGAAKRAAGDEAGATGIWKQTLTELGELTDDNLSAKAVRRLLALDLGDAAAAARIAEQLQKAGFRDPRLAPYATWQS